MPQRPLRVGLASAGLGLFATKPFKKGEFIVRYLGQRVTDAESERREARGARYMFEINSFWAIDGSSRRNIARYVNHSCRPNAEALERRRHRIVYVARRRIKPDEEITVDYGKDYFDSYIKKSGCRCAKCREKKNERRRKRRRTLRNRRRRQTASRRRV
jgi:SET domain-containing protein